MQVSGAPAARNGNPGIVPAHLAKPMPAAPERPTAATGPDAPKAVNATRWGSLVVFPREDMIERAPVRSDKDAAVGAIKETQDFFRSLGVTDRDGNDDQLTVALARNFPNAAYDMENDAMYIGRDPETGKSFAQAKDVVAHEYSHRVIHNMLQLRPGGEQGAMHESLADTFASAMDDDWTIGEDMVPGGIRDMLNPERHGDPAHASQFVRTRQDNGGVHINNGIPNKAAALIGEQLGRKTMAQIYVDAMRNHMDSSSGIVDTAKATMAAASERFGQSSEQADAVKQAWDAVGILDYVNEDRALPKAAPRSDGRRVIIVWPRG